MEVFSLDGLFDRKQKTYWNSVNPFLLFEYQNNNDFSIHSLLLKPMPLTKICIQSRSYYNKQTYGKDRLQKSRETNERGWARTINLQNFVRLIYRGILKGVPQIKLNMKRSLLGGLGSIYKIRNLLSLFFSSCPREKIKLSLKNRPCHAVALFLWHLQFCPSCSYPKNWSHEATIFSLLWNKCFSASKFVSVECLQTTVSKSKTLQFLLSGWRSGRVFSVTPSEFEFLVVISLLSEDCRWYLALSGSIGRENFSPARFSANPLAKRISLQECILRKDLRRPLSPSRCGTLSLTLLTSFSSSSLASKIVLNCRTVCNFGRNRAVCFITASLSDHCWS